MRMQGWIGFWLAWVPAMVGCMGTQGRGPVRSEIASPGVTLELNALSLTSTSLDLRYVVRNGLDKEVWLCVDNEHVSDFPEVFLSDDCRTLMIRRRIHVPSAYEYFRWPTLPYVRMAPGEVRSEELSLKIPVQSTFLFAHPVLYKLRRGRGGAGSQSPSDLAHVNRLAVEIGYFMTLPDPLTSEGLHAVSPAQAREGEDSVRVGYRFQRNTGHERVASLTVEGIDVPYREIADPIPKRRGQSAP